eukprot:Skav224148  [mRNA]  locus=scaffold462:407059:411790:- [translate_table: standard]
MGWTTGEGLDWQHIRNEFYAAMPESFGEVSVDDCINSIMASKPGLRFLDLGCGVGALLARLRRERGEEVDWSSTFGGEIGPASVQLNQLTRVVPGFPDFFDTQLLRFNLDYLADHADKELASKRFDLITSHYCWCHLQDPLGALICAFGLLSAGGVLIFIEPLHAPSNSLPYVDHRLYHWRDDAVTKPLFMRQLLQHWQQEVAVFSAVERGDGERKHVLALRKHAEHQQLSLPAFVRPGSSECTLPSIREERLRRGDLEPFVTPSARSFPEWLQKAKTQRLQRVVL